MAVSTDKIIGSDLAGYINQLIVSANSDFSISPPIPVVTVPVLLADFNHAMNRYFIIPFNAAVPQSAVAYVHGPNVPIANYVYDTVVRAVQATPAPPPPPAPPSPAPAPPPSPPPVPPPGVPVPPGPPDQPPGRAGSSPPLPPAPAPLRQASPPLPPPSPPPPSRK